jgi:hypothetical protein
MFQDPGRSAGVFVLQGIQPLNPSSPALCAIAHWGG